MVIFRSGLPRLHRLSSSIHETQDLSNGRQDEVVGNPKGLDFVKATRKESKRNVTGSKRAPEIVVISYPHVQQSAVSGLSDLFEIADRLARERIGSKAPLLRVSHLSAWDDADGSPWNDRTTLTDHEPTVLVLPPTLDAPSPTFASPALVEFLRVRHQAGAILASVCLGAFVLAESGLLAGRTITTHWAYEKLFADRFPNVNVDTDKLIADDGDIITAGGLMAWIDLGLRIVDRLLGPTAMLETARYMLVDPPGREQRYYSVFAPRLSHGDAGILKVQHWLQKADLSDVTVHHMAKRAGLEERTFLRRFNSATGLTPIQYTQHLRVGKAREILETSSESLDEIAWRCGYGDTGAFRRVFARVTGLTPTDYRRRFGHS
jgi:transcriptional regulator GlxA family with amidase domain